MQTEREAYLNTLSERGKRYKTTLDLATQVFEAIVSLPECQAQLVKLFSQQFAIPHKIDDEDVSLNQFEFIRGNNTYSPRKDGVDGVTLLILDAKGYEVKKELTFSLRKEEPEYTYWDSSYLIINPNDRPWIRKPQKNNDVAYRGITQTVVEILSEK